MKNVKLPSGFVKVERTEEEKHNSFSVNDEFVENIKERISSSLTDAIIKACIKSKGRR
jgi:hypothetical protein